MCSPSGEIRSIKIFIVILRGGLEPEWFFGYCLAAKNVIYIIKINLF